MRIFVCTRDSLLSKHQVRFEADDIFTYLLDVFLLHLQDSGKVFFTSNFYIRLETLKMFNKLWQSCVWQEMWQCILFIFSDLPGSHPSCTLGSSQGARYEGFWWDDACGGVLHLYLPSLPLVRMSLQWFHQEPKDNQTSLWIIWLALDYGGSLYWHNDYRLQVLEFQYKIIPD